MNIQNIKQLISSKTGAFIPTLLMTQQKNEAKELQPWASYWDNDKRVRITMHMEVLASIVENPTQDGLAVKEQLEPAKGDRAAYTRFVVIKPTEVLATF